LFHHQRQRKEVLKHWHQEEEKDRGEVFGKMKSLCVARKYKIKGDVKAKHSDHQD